MGNIRTIDKKTLPPIGSAVAVRNKEGRTKLESNNNTVNPITAAFTFLAGLAYLPER